MSLVLPLKNLRRDGAGAYQFPVWDDGASEWVANGWVEYAEDLGVDTNTTTSYVTKITKTTSASAPAGVYLVTYSHSWSSNLAASSTDVQFRVDSTEEYFIRQHTVPSGATNQPRVGATLEFTLTSGAHTFDIRFRRNLGTGWAQVGSSTIFIKWVRR